MKIREGIFWNLYKRYYRGCCVPHPSNLINYVITALCGMVAAFLNDISAAITTPLLVWGGVCFYFLAAHTEDAISVIGLVTLSVTCFTGCFLIFVIHWHDKWGRDIFSAVVGCVSSFLGFGFLLSVAGGMDLWWGYLWECGVVGAIFLFPRVLNLLDFLSSKFSVEPPDSYYEDQKNCGDG